MQAGGAAGAGGRAAPGLVVFSPLPPARSGIADYTAELLPALGRMVPVTAVVASGRDLQPVQGAEVVAEVEYRRRSALHGLPHLYQMGNSLHHEHVYRMALRRPGVVVLHDPVLHHLVEALTLGRGDWAGYEAVMAENYGPAGRRLARLRRAGVFSPSQRNLLPLHRHLLDRSRGVLVHSRFAGARLEVAADVPVRVVPFHLSPSASAQDGLDRAAARARLGLPGGDEPLLLQLGFVTRNKGLDVALGALALLKSGGVACRLVVAGEADGSVDVPGMVRQAGVGDRVHLLGWVTDADFFALLRAADLLLLLRFPPAGESSAVLVRALGVGLPALAYDAGPASEYPDRFVEKIPFGPDPAVLVASAAERLLADLPGLRARGGDARQALRRGCTPEVSASRVLAACRECEADRMLHTCSTPAGYRT
ncbi:MAG: glycosyltransferase [Acetobacteraceae bacterium]|nr:glycosyltransferase [Acetobacteraceae bacterium]